MERQRGAYVITVTVEEDGHGEETRQEIVRLIREYSRGTDTVVTVS